MSRDRKLLIGLTGGIASGKSAVADRLAELGASIVDTDRIARDVVEPGTDGLKAVVARFGRGILDQQGRLDRRRLRERVFADPQARSDLNAILHPRIGAESMQRVARAEGPYVVLVVPLLVEGSMADVVDRVLVIDVPVETQLRRVMARDNIDRDQAQSIMAAQASRETRLQRADDVIVNDGSLADLHEQVDTLHRRYLEMASERTRET
ncbi:dephospho-CoA kinase [Ectothiorhodospiraceae bacterium WFHF3C12]|nr:dephospho-CoA kinase [Ectothiorhodospiraceae bacterium WFHF3C12]